MGPVLVAIIAILAVHYVLAVSTLYLLMKDMGLIRAIIPWNLAVLLLPVVGPVAYLLYRTIAKRMKKQGAVKSAEESEDGNEVGREKVAAALGEDQGEQLQQKEHR